MNLNDLNRLEEQILSYKPNINARKKQHVINRLRSQLFESKAIVRIQRMDAECESLMVSLKKRLMLLQDILIPKVKAVNKNFLENGERNINLSSDSSDDEIESVLMSKKIKKELLKDSKQIKLGDTLETNDPYMPLTLHRKCRQRKTSCKSYSSTSTSNSNVQNKQQDSVATSRVPLHSEELKQEEFDSTPTLHIKIPSLHRGNVHYIILDSLNFARKVFDYRANEIKQQSQQKSNFHNSKITKSHNKKLKRSIPVLQDLPQQEQEFELSQLIQDVMTEACNDETLQAITALENNKIIVGDNDLDESDIYVPNPQSSEEISNSQNWNVVTEKVRNTCGCNVEKKSRKYNKRASEELKGPPKKRGRKSKKDNSASSAQVQLQPPTKSNLAKYVELFSNDCELTPGSFTPAASSTTSQPLVSSTTHNFEVTNQLPEQQEQQTLSQEPITYYIDGDWLNGGQFQLISTNQEDINASFQNFISYVDASGDSNKNVTERVLECNNTLSTTIPLSMANIELQNKSNHSQAMQQYQTIQNSSVPIINIQIPTVPNSILGPSEPPLPAHTHEEVLDLSTNYKTSVNKIPNETHNYKLKPHNPISFCRDEDANCSPLDLSVKGYAKEKILDNCLTIDTQDEDFIRHLIEQNDFEYKAEDLKKVDDSKMLWEHDQDGNKSFKCALDMPLLDFDATDFVQLVQHTENKSNKGQTILTDENAYITKDKNYDCDTDTYKTKYEDHNSNTEVVVKSSAENNLHFSDQATTDMFNKLINICPNNQFINNENLSAVTAVDNSANEMNHLERNDKNTASDKPPPSTTLAFQLVCPNNAPDTSLNTNTTDDQLKHLKLTESADLKNCGFGEINNVICNDTQHNPMGSKKEQIVETTFETSANSPDVNKIFLSLSQDIVSEVEKSKTRSIQNKNVFDINDKPLINILKTDKEDVIDVNDECLHNSSSIKLEDDAINKFIKEHEANTATPVVFNKSEKVFCVKGGDDIGAPLMEFPRVKSTSKGNVVFSVAKVNLSDDGNLYSTDSDSFSGKSVQIIKSVKDEFQDISDSKNSKATYEPLTMLELESKLEDSLDFDEMLDDALSLSTSCFNSPIEDRFEDSVADIDTTTTTNVLEQNDRSPNSTKNKDLKHYKIPKLSTPEETNFGKSTNSVPKVGLPTNVDELKRTVKKELVQLNTTADAKIASTDLDEKTNLENFIFNVFGVSCLPYLVDKCYSIAHCKLCHQLNDFDAVYKLLMSLDKTEISLAYQVLYNHSKLFTRYFEVFCSYCSAKNDRFKLLNMVNDCERYPEYAEFIIVIYESLVKCGLSRVNSCRLILKRIRERNIAASIIKPLVDMIMKSDWTMFTDFIEKYTQDVYKFNFRIGILEQMAPAVLNSKGPHLKQVFGKCVQTLHCEDTVLLVNSPILIQCVALLTTNTTL